MRLIISAALILCAVHATEPVVEPESTDVFFRLAPDGNLTELEPAAGVAHASAKGFIAYKSSAALVFAGDRSPTRLPSGIALEFIVRPSLASVDPAAIYHLRQLERRKRTRELQIVSGTTVPFNSSVTVSPERGLLPFKAERYGKNSYRITVAPLAPGEYAFGRIGGREVFCFGVD